MLAIVLICSGCGDDSEPRPATTTSDPARDRAMRVEKAQEAFVDGLDRACRPYEKAFDSFQRVFKREAESFDLEPAYGYQLSSEGVSALAALVDERIVPRIEPVIESLEDVSAPIKNRRASKQFLDELEQSLEKVVADPKVFFVSSLKSRAFGRTDVLSEDLELASCRVGYDLYS